MSTCNVIIANADVSGIGIRVNLYITMLLMALVPDVPGITTPLLQVLVANAGISGVALLITAIVQTSQNQLSLYHAIFIIHMLYFTGIIVAPSGHYRGGISALTIRALISFTITYGCFMLFAGYAFYVWATAPTFGNSPECNDQIKYIFFFKSVRATVGWLRKLWMAGLGATLGLLFIIPLASCMCCCLMARSSSHGEGGGGGYSTHSGLQEQSMKFGKPLAVIYGVVMLELYVKRNRHLIGDGEQQWTFGQIMALVQIISTANEILHFLMSFCSPGEEEESYSDEETAAQPPVPSSTDSKSRQRRQLPWKGKRDTLPEEGLELQESEAGNRPAHAG
ncbi:hypothetical protein AX15_002081 [Amanita polypyramis BW_CC]|nr:hypothetical protein AX15_002081 [Amanita polypyramis BW_CC]